MLSTQSKLSKTWKQWQVVQKFPGKVSRNSETVEFPNGDQSTENVRNSGSKFEWKENFREKFFANLGIPREVVFFDEILKNAVPFATGSCRKFKPDFLVEWKAPRTSISDVLLLPEATWPRLFKRWIALSTG